MSIMAIFMGYYPQSTVQGLSKFNIVVWTWNILLWDNNIMFSPVCYVGHLVEDTITKDHNFLGVLCQRLDRAPVGIKNWENLAQVLGVPHEMSRKFEFYAHTSPTEDLFEYLENKQPDLTVHQLKTKLKAIHRNDLVQKLGKDLTVE